METIQSSVLCQWLGPVWLWLRAHYQESFLARLFHGISAACGRAASGSAVIGFLTREGVLSKAWPHSMLCRFLTFLINIPNRIVQVVYRRFAPVFDHSLAARVGFSVVEETPLAVAWLMLLVMVIPFKYWNNAYSFAGFILCFILACFAGARKKDFKLDLAAVGPWLVAFAGMVMVAWPLSMYPDQSKRFLVYNITCMLCVIVLVSTVEHWYQLKRLACFTSVAVLVMSIAACYQRMQGILVNPYFVDITVNKGMPGRVWSFYENPNTFGEVLLLLIPVVVAYMLSTKNWFGRLLGLVSTGLGCVAMAMTYSRAGWVGLVFAAFLFVLLWKRHWIPVGILVALAGASLLPDTVFHRIMTIFNTSDTSTTSRFPLYRAALDFLKVRPIQGAGLGSDAVRSAINDLHMFHGFDTFVHCHNIYLQVWCETGLVGLVSFVGGVLWTFKKGAKAVAGALCPPQLRILIIGCISALMGTMLCGMADYIWNYPRVMLIFWFVCALALAGVRVAARGEADPQ